MPFSCIPGGRDEEAWVQQVTRCCLYDKCPSPMIDTFSGDVGFFSKSELAVACRKLSLTRSIKCESCEGTGTKSRRKYQCEVCHGSGVHVIMRPLGPGMMQQIQQACSACGQTGYSVPAGDACHSCHGKVCFNSISIFT